MCVFCGDNGPWKQCLFSWKIKLVKNKMYDIFPARYWYIFLHSENSSWSWANGCKGRLLSGWHLKNERGVFVHLHGRSNFFFGQTCSCHDAPHVGCQGWQTDVRTWASRFSGPSRWWDREVWVLKSSLTSRCVHFDGQIMMLSNLSGF